MYKVFLVDDEIVIREGIRNNVRWDEHRFVLCGEAPDSEIALSMMQELKPDILITDIRMPFMDGLELCRRVTRTMPWIHIVILSGHDDFAYAQEAISLGVKEYLLKPVSAQELEKVLARIANSIGEERAQQADLNALRRQLESSSRLLRESCLMRVLDGVSDEEDVLTEARKLRMNLRANHYSAMLIRLSQPSQMLRARGIVERFAEGYGGAVHLCARGGQIAVLVMGDTVSDLEERAYAFAQAVQHEIGRDGDVGLRVAIGPTVCSLPEISESLNVAGRLLTSMAGRNRIMGVTDVDPHEGLMHLDVIPLYEQLQYANASDAPQVLDRYLQSLGGVLVQSVLMTNYIIVDILLSASRIVKQCGGEPDEVLPETQHMGELIERIHSPEDILRLSRDLLTRALTYRDRHSQSRHSATVRKACQYIEANHQRPEIMLRDVADHVALSNNHFCTVFSQEMGMTFIEYLTRLRMERAKEYLKSSDLPSGEIAELVGYNDPHYFRYLFKKHMGLNPREYRASCRR